MAAGTADPGSRGIAGDVVTQWRVLVDASACIGSGSCAGIAPRHFRLDGSTAAPVNDLVPPDDDIIAAADSCPSEAIMVYLAEQ